MARHHPPALPPLPDRSVDVPTASKWPPSVAVVATNKGLFAASLPAAAREKRATKTAALRRQAIRVPKNSFRRTEHALSGTAAIAQADDIIGSSAKR